MSTSSVIDEQPKTSDKRNCIVNFAPTVIAKMSERSEGILKQPVHEYNKQWYANHNTSPLHRYCEA